MDPQFSADHLRTLRDAGASTVCAVLDMLDVGGIVTGIGMVVPGGRYAGPAFTVKALVSDRGRYTPADFDIPAYADGAASGQVIVIDAGGAAVSVSGGIAVAATRQRGIAGWLVDGGMRDVDELRESGMPIHLRHGVAVSGRGRVRIEATGVPVTVAGLAVAPGDVLVGDSSGVGVLPPSAVPEAARMAAWIHGRDTIASRRVAEGASFRQAFADATAAYTAAHGPL